MGLNIVHVIGNLGADPEMRFMPNGQPVTNFRVASSRRYNDSQGQTIEETEWFYVVCFGKLAENCNQYLAKGAQAYVQGRLRTRDWEGKDGVKHYRTEVIAQVVQFLTKGASDLKSPDTDVIEVDGDEPEVVAQKADKIARQKAAKAKANPRRKVVKRAVAGWRDPMQNEPF